MNPVMKKGRCGNSQIENAVAASILSPVSPLQATGRALRGGSER